MEASQQQQQQQQQQDELSLLFAQGMHLAAHQHQAHQRHHERSYQQHRHPPPSPPNLVFETPSPQARIPHSLFQTLTAHSIPPSSLLPAQISLYQTSTLPQRLRLLELWRTAPLTPPSMEDQQRYWQGTSLVREEIEARGRYEALMVLRQRGEGRASRGADERMEADMELSRHSRAVEPVYAATPPIGGGLWQPPDRDHGNAGAVQIRNHAEWEAANARIARERSGGFAVGGRGAVNAGADADGDSEMEL